MTEKIKHYTKWAVDGWDFSRELFFFKMLMMLSTASMLVIIFCWFNAWPYLCQTLISRGYKDLLQRPAMAYPTETSRQNIFTLNPISNLKPKNYSSENTATKETSLERLNIMDRKSIVKGVIQKGDTASTLLNDYLPLTQINELCQKSRSVYYLPRIKIGQPYKIILKGNDLVEFNYEIDPEHSLIVQKDIDKFSIMIKSLDS